MEQSSKVPKTFRCLPWIETRRWKARLWNYENEQKRSSTLENLLLIETFLNLIAVILLELAGNFIILPRNMLHQVPSNQKVACLVEKSFRVNTFSNNIGEKNNELSNGN